MNKLHATRNEQAAGSTPIVGFLYLSVFKPLYRRFLDNSKSEKTVKNCQFRYSFAFNLHLILSYQYHINKGDKPMKFRERESYELKK